MSKTVILGKYLSLRTNPLKSPFTINELYGKYGKYYNLFETTFETFRSLYEIKNLVQDFLKENYIIGDLYSEQNKYDR